MPAAREDVAKLREQIALSDAKQLEAMNVQTRRFVSWIPAMMSMLIAGVYFIARNVH